VIQHHLSDALLAEYAAGNLGEAGRLWVVSHLSLCADCQDDLRAWEAVGGAFLENVASDAAEVVPEALWARLEAGEPKDAPTVDGDPALPQPLRSLMGPRSGWKWSPTWPGIWRTKVPVGPVGTRMFVYEFSAGVTVPRHTHSAPEYTLILDGSCHDERGHYAKGDVVLVESEAHTLHIESEGCLVLQWNVGAIRPESPVLALLNKVLGV
jgi:putative transcriptional regulator